MSGHLYASRVLGPAPTLSTEQPQRVIDTGVRLAYEGVAMALESIPIAMGGDPPDEYAMNVERAEDAARVLFGELEKLIRTMRFEVH